MIKDKSKSKMAKSNTHSHYEITTFDNGESYAGQIVNNKRHGRGTYYY